MQIWKEAPMETTLHCMGVLMAMGLAVLFGWVGVCQLSGEVPFHILSFVVDVGFVIALTAIAVIASRFLRN